MLQQDVTAAQMGDDLRVRLTLLGSGRLWWPVGSSDAERRTGSVNQILHRLILLQLYGGQFKRYPGRTKPANPRMLLLLAQVFRTDQTAADQSRARSLREH